MLLEEEVRRLQLLEDRVLEANMLRPAAKPVLLTIGTQTADQESMRQVSLGGKTPGVSFSSNIFHNTRMCTGLAVTLAHIIIDRKLRRMFNFHLRLTGTISFEQYYLFVLLHRPTYPIAVLG